MSCVYDMLNDSACGISNVKFTVELRNLDLDVVIYLQMIVKTISVDKIALKKHNEMTKGLLYLTR